MIPRSRAIRSLFGAAFGLCALFSSRDAGAAKLYFEVRGVREADAAKVCKLGKKAQATLLAALAKRTEVVTDLGKKVSGAALEKELQARGLAGYGVMLRIVRCGHEVLPPAKGKVYRVLMVELAVAIDAEKLPSGQMALAGEGSAQVGTEISRVKEQERQQLLAEALTAAVTQAVERSVAKLTQPAPKARKHRARGKKRGRR